MQPAQVIVIATPAFLLLIALEFWWGWRKGRNTYRLNDALNSIGLGVMSQLVGVLTVFFTLGLYAAAHERFAITRLPADAWWVWLAALVFYDFLYYWHHRMGHHMAVLWAAHVVHHQSEDYNLSTALRQPASYWLFGWVFYLPMAVLGFSPLVFAVVGLIDLLYQYWVHTQHVGRLGWYDRWFCAPSNHRVHHAVNDQYLDKNFGGIFIVWDRLFGTYAEEDPAEPCVYGTRAPLRSWNPLTANLRLYGELLRDAWHTRRGVDKLRVFVMPPGWQPDDIQREQRKPIFTMQNVQRYDPPLPAARAAGAVALFLVVLAGALVFLWNAHRLNGAQQAAAVAALLIGLWLMGRITEGRAER
jgi:sterol desaturase/sphingolipid hydroxylase (fatty acid hydroxylase superfamily)